MGKQKILITGSEGLIGKIIQEPLRKEGHELICLDKKQGKDNKVFDILELNSSIWMKGVDSVIHLAGYAGPAIYPNEMNDNMSMTLRIVDSAARSNVKRMIFASSIHVYNFSHMYEDSQRITSETPTHIHNNKEYYNPHGVMASSVTDYSRSKILSEKINETFYQQYGLSVLNLRLGAVTQDNKPANNPWGKETWLSHEDLIGIIKKAIKFKGFANLVCVSNDRFIDLKLLEEKLDYKPKS